MPNTFPELAQHVGHIIESYQTDLEVRDRELIESFPEVPYLHFTRPLGTHIVFLSPPDDPQWPAPGERAPYLFGTADREHIANDKVSTVEYCVLRAENTRAIYHYDGQALHQLCGERAMQIVRAYRSKLREAWNPFRVLPVERQPIFA